jgi:hypothetical protein
MAVNEDDVQVEQITAPLGMDALTARMGALAEALAPTKEYRMSVRLTPEEYARVEKWKQILQERANGYYTATQKTVLMEALDALDWREAERTRKRKRS